MQTTSTFALLTTLFTSSIFGANDMTFERKSEGTYCEDAAGLTLDTLGTFLASRAEPNVCRKLYEAHKSSLQRREQMAGIA